MRCWHRVLIGALLIATAVAASGCDPDTPPSPTPAILAAHAYVLVARDVAAYAQTADSTVTAATLADQHHDAALQGRLTSLGMLDGAIAIYAPPKKATTILPFQTISSQAVIFSGAAGAATFFSEEQQRVHRAPAGGTIAPLVGAPNNSTDDFAYDSSGAPTGTAEPPQRAFLALMRRGQVVVELFAASGPNSASPSDFIPYITAQARLLQTPVQSG